MIEVNKLCKKYGERLAIQDVSFRVEQGEILGFLGPNGAGKSTTMKILSGCLSAGSGTATANGFDVRKEPLKAKASIGYLPENPPVYSSMDVKAYLTFAARLHNVPGPQIQKAVDVAMDSCGLVDVQNRFIGNLSKGYRQRVGLAQAIVHSPPILILDEPTVGLDPKQIIEIRKLICNLKGKHTVILSTHILPEVQFTCDRVVVIDQGKIIAMDTLEGISRNIASTIKLEVSMRHDPKALIPRIQALPQVSAVEYASDPEKGEHTLVIEHEKKADHRAEIAKLCVQNNLDLLRLNQEKMSLEGAFMKLISKEGE